MALNEKLSVDSMVRRLYFFLLTTLLVGCASTIDYRGKAPDPDQLAKLKIGQSEEEVLTLIGSPTNTSLYGPQKWYYIYKKTAKTSFFDPTTLEEKIIVITFNDQGVVTHITQTTPNGQVINPIRHKTPTVGEEQTILQQVFGNFGRHAKKAEPNKP
jgi:outer membrane protein assembly factor BamE (lipoprotein component of BamABCDE complex)